MKCNIQECNNKAYQKGLCQKHAWRLKFHGSALYIRQIRTCEIDGCNCKHKSNGLCQLHYRRFKKGHVLIGNLKTLSPKRYKIVKDMSHPIAMKNGRIYKHRQVLYNRVNGSNLPCFWCGKPVFWKVLNATDLLCVDHFDHDRHNNTESNLVPSCNSCNAGRMKGYAQRQSVYS